MWKIIKKFNQNHSLDEKWKIIRKRNLKFNDENFFKQNHHNI